jgi:DNA-binding transcriptional LysR family regulator
MAALAASHPEVDVRVRDAEGDVGLRLLLDGDVDLAVAVEYRGAPPEDDGRLRRVPLYAEPFDVVLPPDHDLAKHPEVALHDLAGEDWIGATPGNPCRDVAELACEYAGFTARVRHYSDDFRAVTALAAAGAGVALVPRSALPGTDPATVAVRSVAGTPPTRRVFAALRRGSEDHPLVTVVLEALRHAAGRS